MADYTRQHDFSVKDALTTGDPDKVIKGSEVDEELDAIVTMSGTKINVVTGHTTNNLASLDSTGNLDDAGILKTDVCKLSGTQTLTGAKTFSGGITATGAVTATGTTVSVATPTADAHAATKKYVDDSVVVINEISNTITSTTTTIPFDGTIPQNTEGVEVLSAAITPRSAANRLVIDCDVIFYQGVDEKNVCLALFKGSDANAVAVTAHSTHWTSGNFPMQTARLTYVTGAGTTSSTTFRIRIGSEDSTTLYVNGIASTKYYGGVARSRLTIREYLQ